MYGRKYMTGKSNSFYEAMSYPLDATVEMLSEALDRADAVLGRPYHVWVQTVDHGVRLGMEPTISQLND
jgi:hypothetical protein